MVGGSAQPLLHRLNMKSTFEQQILSIICSVFDAYSAVLFLPDEAAQKHYLAASFSLGDNIPAQASIMPGKGLVGWIIHNRQPLLVDNFDQNQSNLGYYGDESDEQIKAFMGFPVPSGGALCVDSKRQYSFTEKDCKILQLFAELIAGGNRIDSEEDGDAARFFAELGVIQDLRFRFRRWPEFLRSFLRVIARATRFDYCAFATLQEDGETYCLEAESAPLLLANGQPLCLPLGAGITGWVFRNEQPVFAESNPSSTALFGKLGDIPDFPAAICIPVMVNKSCRGVLCIAHTEPARIDDAMRSFTRQAVDHLSMFLENLYLKNRISRLMPRAKLQYSGPRPYDPDSAPAPRRGPDDQA